MYKDTPNEHRPASAATTHLYNLQQLYIQARELRSTSRALRHKVLGSWLEANAETSNGSACEPQVATPAFFDEVSNQVAGIHQLLAEALESLAILEREFDGEAV